MDRPAKLLIVDDDADTSSMLEFYFGNLGYEVTVAKRAGVAIRLAHDARPDLILLDIMLPDADGYTVARTLRADRYTAHIPIIFLTARGSSDDRVAGLEAGADDFIAKPFDAQELRLRIERTLRLRSAS